MVERADIWPRLGSFVNGGLELDLDQAAVDIDIFPPSTGRAYVDDEIVARGPQLLGISSGRPLGAKSKNLAGSDREDRQT